MPSLVGSGRIERLEILNFKSLKCHQIVGPFKNFAAIIGASGAGRSDLVDALTFVLGVRSFQLRGVQQRDSVHALDDREHAELRGRIAFVKLFFSTGSGEEIKFGRAITASGTSEYRINNIPVTWDIYNNTMKGLDILGEIDSDACKEYKEPTLVSEPLSAPDELKKIHVELEIQKARAEEKMIPMHQKRKMLAAERRQKREQKQKQKADEQLRLRTEIDLRAAEDRTEMAYKGKMESLSADIERTASDFEALDQYEILREKERKSVEESEVTRKAAIEDADKWKVNYQPSFRPPSPLSVLDKGDAAADAVDVTKAVNHTSSKLGSNVKERGMSLQSVGIPSEGIDTGDKLNRDEGAGVSIDVEKNVKKNRFLQRKNSLRGTRNPGLEERKLIHGSHKLPEKPSVAHVLRRLEDYDDQMYWSDTVEDRMDPDKDSLSKAEELAEDIYRDAMDIHKWLSVKTDIDAAFAASRVSGKEHNLIAETKETCGAVMYANSHVQNGRSEMLCEESVLILAMNSESRSLSFSQTSQCSDTPVGVLGPVEKVHLDRVEANKRVGMIQLNQSLEEKTTNGDDHMLKTFVKDFRDTEKDGESRIVIEKEMSRLRRSNVRKQVKIDSLQKWRAYYKSELAEKDRKLEEIEQGLMRDLKKKDKAVQKMEKKYAKAIAHRDAKHDEVEDKLRGEIKELNLVIEELSGQLYDMEEHLAAGGIPYKPSLNENTGPSSKTLLSAVISVKEAAHTFSRTFMSYLKQHLTKARDLDEQICLESEVIVARPSDYKFLVQSFICRRMFLDFDSECFNIDSCMTEVFDIEEHSRACFQEYMSYRNVSETVTLLTDNRPHSAFLREFCFKKFLHIVSESTEEAFFGDFNHSDDICAGRHPSSRFYESYCKLAVSVWLLHRLAFSFQPPARMIAVRKGAQFNPTYMESAVPGISGGDLGGTGGSALPFEALVGLMVHPGFRVGSSIIPAQVYLVTT